MSSSNEFLALTIEPQADCRLGIEPNKYSSFEVCLPLHHATKKRGSMAVISRYTANDDVGIIGGLSRSNVLLRSIRVLHTTWSQAPRHMFKCVARLSPSYYYTIYTKVISNDGGI